MKPFLVQNTEIIPNENLPILSEDLLILFLYSKFSIFTIIKHNYYYQLNSEGVSGI